MRSWLTPADRCLELGSGFGRITQILEPKFREVFCLEFASRNLSVAKGRLKWAYLARADISKIPARDSTFDCVVMVRVIHLLPDPRAVMNEVARVAKDGATVIISMPNLAMNTLVWAAMKLRGGNAGLGPSVWPFDESRYLVPPQSFTPDCFRLERRRGTGLFDNPAGRILERASRLYLLDVATSPLWFFKLDIFLKFIVLKPRPEA